MKYLLAVALAMFLPAAASAATVHDYRYDFNGTSAVLAPGSDSPAGDVFRAGDGFRMTISAGADRGWTIGSAFTSNIDLSFYVAECGFRTGRFDLTLRRDGVDVYSFSRGPFGQSCVHMGGQNIRYVAGTIFDEIVLSYTLLSSTVATSTIGSVNPAFWGAMWQSSRVVRGEVPDAPPAVVPAPSALALMLGGLGLLSLARRRRA
jgi:hypothetical protein